MNKKQKVICERCSYKERYCTDKKKLLKAIEKSKCPMNPDMCHIEELKKELGMKDD
jgi:hypothetical protein